MGGSARGGGAYRGGRTMNRTPSMSRASNRTSQVAQRSQIRSSASQGRGQQVRQRPQQRPSATNRTELRNQVQQYAQNRPAKPSDRQALAQKTQDFSKTRRNQLAQNRQLSDRSSQRLRQTRPYSKHWFDRHFFDRHNIGAAYVNARNNWWRPAAWTTLATWGAWNWSTPYYYDNGYAYPITTEETTYSYPYSTTTTYQPQQPQFIQTQPLQTDQANASEEWLPLGVFAVASNVNEAAQTHRFIPLAINHQGEIAGVFYNSTTNAAQDLVGMVDTNSQMAYWTLANRTDSPIASTGIYNLTGDETPINVHFSDGSDQSWILVRLEQGE